MANKDLIINSPFNEEQKALALLMCTAQELNAKMTKRIKPFNISLTQLHILHLLSHSTKKSLTVNQIKELMIDESPNVSRALNKLMDNNLIIKKRSTKDQRIVSIHITKEGEGIHEEADKQLMDISLGLPKNEVSKLYKILTQIQ